MKGEIHKDDEPIIRATIKDQDGNVVDISGATDMNFVVLKPDRTTRMDVDATFTTDGTDGKMQYQFDTGELNQEGDFEYQGFVILPSGPFHSDIYSFKVHRNL